MAQLTSNGRSLLVSLSAAGRIEALRGDIEIPLSCVREIEVLDDAIHEIHGLTPAVSTSSVPICRAGSRWAPSSPARTRRRPSRRYTTTPRAAYAPDHRQRRPTRTDASLTLVARASQ